MLSVLSATAVDDADDNDVDIDGRIADTAAAIRCAVVSVSVCVSAERPWRRNSVGEDANTELSPYRTGLESAAECPQQPRNARTHAKPM